MFNRLLWSFKVYIVKLNKRPTQLWCFTQPGLEPLSQGFEVQIGKWLNCIFPRYISNYFSHPRIRTILVPSSIGIGGGVPLARLIFLLKNSANFHNIGL